ncbi:MAG TPA: hypothetical protein VK923_16695 [Euzebyales bacterium]|nr:hypothetical protein [Euzebyales bacterium]
MAAVEAVSAEGTTLTRDLGGPHRPMRPGPAARGAAHDAGAPELTDAVLAALD